MNILENKKQQLIEHAKTLMDLSAEETPPLIRWNEIALLLKESSIFLTTFIIPKIEIEPRYSSSAPKVAEFVPPNRADLEVKADESSASLVRDDAPTNEFLAAGRNGK